MKKTKLTCEINGLKWLRIRSNFPNPFSTTLGKERRRRVCPVGAVSNTTHEKFMPFTNLKSERTFKNYQRNKKEKLKYFEILC